MQELLLTHIYQGEATIVLVDYEKYTAQVKKVKLDEPNKLDDSLQELVDSGKLRLYRESKHLDSRKEAWLAVDPDRGSLIVNTAGEVKCLPTSDYLAGITTSNYYLGGAVSDIYRPRRFGEPVESFYQFVKDTEKEMGGTLSEKEVIDKIIDRTGYQLTYVGSEYGSNTYNEYTIDPYGATLDQVEIKGTTKSVTFKLESGYLDKLYIDSAKRVTINLGETAKIGEVELSPRVQELLVRSNYGDGEQPPVITTSSPNSILNNLIGYNKADADLTMFRYLTRYERCWNMNDSSKHVPLNLKLPRVDGAVIINSFHDVEIQTLFPYADGSGTLDLTGIHELRESFDNFKGISFIRGTVTGEIKASIVSEEFDGRFEVNTPRVVASFAYKVSKLRRYGDPELEPKYFPEGVINIDLTDYDPTKSYEYTLGSEDSNIVDYWKQTQNLIREQGVPKLRISLLKKVSYTVDTSISECSVFGGWHAIDEILSNISFKREVGTLKSGAYPYTNIRTYGDKCFSNKQFPATHTCILHEGLAAIGARAFYATSGLDYIVIPRSCVSIGAAAFSEAKSSVSGLSTICVYRDSYAHRWSKGKNLQIKIIDSLDEIPKPTSIETEGDFLAAFVDTPSWADVSKPFVAKALTMGTVDILDYIKPVCSLPLEVKKHLDAVYALGTWVHMVSDGRGGTKESRKDLAVQGIGERCAEGKISRYLLHAATLNAVYGSSTDLLCKEVMTQYNWTPTKAYDVTRWVGIPKITGYTTGKGHIRIYEKEGNVYYVGCADDIHETGIDSENIASNQEILSADTLIGADVEGRLEILSRWLYTGASIKVHGENLQGDVLSRIRQFFHDGMVCIDKEQAAKSGRVKVKERVIYDIVNNKLYKFSGTSETDMGTYRGQLDLAEFRDKSGVADREAMCLTHSEVQIAKAEIAPPAFEMEYCRKAPKFGLLSRNPNVMSFIKLLSKSGLVKRVTQSTIEKRISNSYENKLLADGTKVLSGRTSGGLTHVLGIEHKGKYYGFESAFNLLEFANIMDTRVQGLKAYPDPTSGYMNMTTRQDLIPVTPIPYVPPAYEGRNNVEVSHGVHLALDLNSGKLVLAYGDRRHTCVVCAFASAKDAREFYTEFGTKFFGYPEEWFGKSLENTLHINYTDDKYVVDLHPHMGNDRLANSLAVIGGLEYRTDHSMDKSIYNETILKYCRI